MPMFRKFVELLCTQSASDGKLLEICQIGANDGRINDPIYDIILRHRHATRILLVEPQLDIVPHLRANYAYHPAATIWAGAIGGGSELRLFRLKPELYEVFERRYLKDSPLYRVPSGFSSASRDHVVHHLAGNLPPHIDLAEAIDEFRAPCSPLLALLRQVEWQGSGVDVLQVDTEGADDETLYACDLEQLAPVVINFEHAHLPQARKRDLASYLGGLGYGLHEYEAMNSVAIHMAKAVARGINV